MQRLQALVVLGAILQEECVGVINGDEEVTRPLNPVALAAMHGAAPSLPGLNQVKPWIKTIFDRRALQYFDLNTETMSPFAHNAIFENQVQVIQARIAWAGFFRDLANGLEDLFLPEPQAPTSGEAVKN